MINRVSMLMGLAALLVALAACSASEEPASLERDAAPAPAPAAAPAPVKQQLVTAQPEGFNTIGGSATCQ